MSHFPWMDGKRAERTREVRTFDILSSNEHGDLVVAAPVEELLETLDADQPKLQKGKVKSEPEGLQERIKRVSEEQDIPFAPKKSRTEEAKKERALAEQRRLDAIIDAREIMDRQATKLTEIFKIPTLRAKMPIDAPVPSCIASPDPHSRPE